jgi:hypothetical protein
MFARYVDVCKIDICKIDVCKICRCLQDRYLQDRSRYVPRCFQDMYLDVCQIDICKGFDFAIYGTADMLTSILVKKSSQYCPNITQNGALPKKDYWPKNNWPKLGN